jgi:hypothetical protein
MTSKSSHRSAKLRRAKPRRSARHVRSRTKAPAKSSRDKVSAFRSRMRANGMRLVQMWLPDVRTAEFAAEARRQCQLANNSSFADQDQAWIDSMSDWTNT